jgi:hypothetical protein
LSNVTVENRNGSVTITVPEQSSFAYQFDATNGDIQSDFSEIKIPEGGLQKKTVSGTAGKGGPLLHISTSQGDISVKKGSVMPLPPIPPLPKLTALPPGTRESIEEAKQAAREATAEAKAAAKEAAAEAKKAAKEAQQQSKHPEQ